MIVRRLALVLCVLSAGALLSQCGAKACDISNCLSGCCDSTGTCKEGTSHWACGTEGAACTTCRAGDVCNASSRVCETPVVVKPDPDAACTRVATWPTPFKEGGYYAFADFNYGALYSGDPLNPPDGGYDELDLEVWYLDGGTFAPRNVTYLVGDTYTACDTCLLVYTGCTGVGQCDASFLAQRGSVSVTAATKDETAGVLQATATNLKLLEWDLSDDTRVANGRCYAVESATWNLSWNADAGP